MVHPNDEADSCLYIFHVRKDMGPISTQREDMMCLLMQSPDEQLGTSISICFTTASSYTDDGIYDIDWVLNVTYTSTYKLIGCPQLLYPFWPFMKWAFLNQKLALYLDSIRQQPDDHLQYPMYIRKEMKENKDILLNPRALVLFTSPSIENKSIYVMIMSYYLQLEVTHDTSIHVTRYRTL